MGGMRLAFDAIMEATGFLAALTTALATVLVACLLGKSLRKS